MQSFAGLNFDLGENATWFRSWNMKNFVGRFIKDESGATAIEYGLMAALIAVVIIVSAKALGTKVSAVFDKVQGNM